MKNIIFLGIILLIATSCANSKTANINIQNNQIDHNKNYQTYLDNIEFTSNV